MQRLKQATSNTVPAKNNYFALWHRPQAVSLAVELEKTENWSEPRMAARTQIVKMPKRKKKKQFVP